MEEANFLFEMNPLLILEWVCPPDWNQPLLPGEELVVAVKVLKVNRVPWKKINDDDVVFCICECVKISNTLALSEELGLQLLQPIL